jgi:hypothetical protein
MPTDSTRAIGTEREITISFNPLAARSNPRRSFFAPPVIADVLVSIRVHPRRVFEISPATPDLRHLFKIINPEWSSRRTAVQIGDAIPQARAQRSERF